VPLTLANLMTKSFVFISLITTFLQKLSSLHKDFSQ